MYSNSSVRIKLLQKLSDKIDILVGTEQGHPMSPELFKVYILDLSTDLNEDLDDMRLPVLNNNRISHLLYADDLALLALDDKCLQTLIKKLENFCPYWGLTANMDKTAIMVFNHQGRLLKCGSTFVYRTESIQTTRKYTYLGIVFNLNGSFKDALAALRQKALRSYFSIKKLIDWKYLKRSSIIKLINKLLVPILTYGCQIWMPYTMQKHLSALLEAPNKTHLLLSNIAKHPAEKVYLACLIWVLGVHKRTSNTAVWGDCGAYPLLIKNSKHVFDYFYRVSADDFGTSLVKDAVIEQKNLALYWYITLSKAQDMIALGTPNATSLTASKPGAKFRTHLENCFRKHWEYERKCDTKLNGFYNNYKAEFCMEKYVVNPHKKYHRSLAAIRMSSHRLHIETGRYNGTPRNKHICRGCVTDDAEIVEGFLNLPECVLQVEDEMHTLFDCDYYTDVRSTNGLDELRLAAVNYAPKCSQIPV